MSRHLPLPGLRFGLHALAAALGAKAGYQFGIQIGGAPLGFLAAANCAVFAWLMVGAAADLLARLRRR